MPNDVKIIDCKKFCKMTSEMRNSKYCNGEARIVDGDIFYGCSEAIKSEPESEKLFFGCKLWDMGLKDSCDTCKLPCKNNANKNFKRIAEQKRELRVLIDDLRPNMMLYGVSANQVEKISEVYTKKGSDGEVDEIGAEGIRIANNANKLLRMAMDGKMVNPSFVGAYSKYSQGRLKKLIDKKKNKKKKP